MAWLLYIVLLRYSRIPEYIDEAIPVHAIPRVT